MSESTSSTGDDYEYGGDYPAGMHVHEYYRPPRRRKTLAITHLEDAEGMKDFSDIAEVLSRQRGSHILLTDAPDFEVVEAMTVALYVGGALVVKKRVTRKQLKTSVEAWMNGGELVL